MVHHPDPTTCPRCGTARLVRRPALLRLPGLREGLPLALWLRLRLSRRRSSIRRTQYVCELCGHRWRVDEAVATAEDAKDAEPR